MGLHPKGLLIKRANLDTDMPTGRMPCDDGGEASASQEMPKIARKAAETGQEAGHRLPVAALRRNAPCQHCYRTEGVRSPVQIQAQSNANRRFAERAPRQSEGSKTGLPDGGLRGMGYVGKIH